MNNKILQEINQNLDIITLNIFPNPFPENIKKEILDITKPTIFNIPKELSEMFRTYIGIYNNGMHQTQTQLAKKYHKPVIKISNDVGNILNILYYYTLIEIKKTLNSKQEIEKFKQSGIENLFLPNIILKILKENIVIINGIDTPILTVGTLLQTKGKYIDKICQNLQLNPAIIRESIGILGFKFQDEEEIYESAYRLQLSPKIYNFLLKNNMISVTNIKENIVLIKTLSTPSIEQGINQALQKPKQAHLCFARMDMVRICKGIRV